MLWKCHWPYRTVRHFQIWKHRTVWPVAFPSRFDISRHFGHWDVAKLGVSCNFFLILYKVGDVIQQSLMFLNRGSFWICEDRFEVIKGYCVNLIKIRDLVSPRRVIYEIWFAVFWNSLVYERIRCYSRHPLTRHWAILVVVAPPQLVGLAWSIPSSSTLCWNSSPACPYFLRCFV